MRMFNKKEKEEYFKSPYRFTMSDNSDFRILLSTMGFLPETKYILIKIDQEENVSAIYELNHDAALTLTDYAKAFMKGHKGP